EFLMCPRKSKVRHTHPRPAIPRARSRSRSWLPPQPWTNKTPGTRLGGARKVPAIRSSSTVISSVSLRVPISFHHHVLSDQSQLGVLARKSFNGAGGRDGAHTE